MSRDSLSIWGGFTTMLGGALWIVLRPLVLTTWGRTVFGFDYVDYNRMMVAPLLLLLLGVVALLFLEPASTGRLGRWGLAIVALGLATSLAGVIVEFWVAGGLRGNRAGAMLGWGLYGLGLLAQTIGLGLFGAGALRGRRLPTWLGFLVVVMAALPVLWFPMIAMRLDSLSILDQVLYGAGWMVLGYALGPRPSALPAAHRAYR